MIYEYFVQDLEATDEFMSFEGTDKTQDTILEIDNMNSSDTEQSKTQLFLEFLFNLLICWVSVASSSRSLQACIGVILRH